MSTSDGSDAPAGLTDTGRVEAFSDGVFAIAVTLLVLDLKAPEHAPGQLLDALIRQWPAYLGYVASFGYVAVIWLNHHQAFTAIKQVDKGVHLANIALLFTTALIPFPTAVLSRAFIDGADTPDARTAVALYAGILAAMCASWLLLFDQVSRCPEQLVADQADPRVFAAQRFRSLTGIVAYLVAGVIGVVWSPMVALAVFVVMPAFYAINIPGIGRRDSTHH
ncbi:hypothetical protein ABW16_21265 [Mycolicibacter heraklionensis]|uniref:DUF1211 domain-containing membrane protein n=1 Tax=Mycolicibacter heraklionensis TaxID=512402 RepID=A0ABR5FA89_9MYCO|nr:TMEM175 family protein [Mycolicibacter heraklionensis]KLO25984.1 hypothetical protein ABW16_21265 [Mycolicibacter heraklionensis]